MKNPFSMKELSQIFLRGVLLLLPLFISIYILLWLAQGIDGLFTALFEIFFENAEVPFGLGLVVGVALIFLIGALSELFIARFISEFIEKLVNRIPVIGTIFNSIKNLTDYINPKYQSARGKTVVVTLPESQTKVIGFLTQSNLNSMPDGLNNPDYVTVYVPLSYMVGGLSLFVPKKNVQEINMTFEKTMQGTLTGWVKKS